LVLKHL